MKRRKLSDGARVLVLGEILTIKVTPVPNSAVKQTRWEAYHLDGTLAVPTAYSERKLHNLVKWAGYGQYEFLD